jgi:formylglycine-generating enzyme required for sulfatase activity
VVNVSWNDAVAFCDWLSKEEGESYRLPTEAEWEYSCRAGRATRHFSGDDPETLAEIGNVADATVKEKFPNWSWPIKARDGYTFTAPVGRFQPNAFGLFDMHGNVGEWCADWYDANYYAKLPSPAVDPHNLFQSESRVARGGGWRHYLRYCRSGCRGGSTPDTRDNYLGFRVARGT